jgi:hypothetical protein
MGSVLIRTSGVRRGSSLIVSGLSWVVGPAVASAERAVAEILSIAWPSSLENELKTAQGGRREFAKLGHNLPLFAT